MYTSLGSGALSAKCTAGFTIFGYSLATIAFDRESAQMSQILSSQGKNAPSDPSILTIFSAFSSLKVILFRLTFPQACSQDIHFLARNCCLGGHQPSGALTSRDFVEIETGFFSECPQIRERTKNTYLEVAKRTKYSEDRGLKVRSSLATIAF